VFNLGTLLQVSALTMGVASATPIRNAQKNHVLATENETITNDYDLTLQYQNSTNQTFNPVPINNHNMTGYDYETKNNYTINSNFINVQATAYESIAYTTRIDEPNLEYVQNYETIQNGIGGINEHTTMYLMVLQITPYNYNLNTETSIKLYMQFDGFTDQPYSWNEIRVDHQYFVKRVYTTNQDNWSSYINKQLINYTANSIIQDIKDVNNGFYYTETDEITEITSLETTDVTEISIVPSKTNYIILNYVPVIKASQKDPNTNQWNDFGTNYINVPVVQQEYGYTTMHITGTNIIPDGTYEVIDIPGLMWQILTMPFAFISQAFNLTLFPGTPYQVNISNLFLSIIAIIVFVWLITLFLKMKG